MFGINKKGALEWEYLAAIVLVLVLVIVLILFSDNLKNILVSKAKDFFSDILPSSLGR